ncbi:MAG: hypothetical protein ACI9S8_002903 [Chlamydiales bacterium]|jgi:hypothetical protein
MSIQTNRISAFDELMSLEDHPQGGELDASIDETQKKISELSDLIFLGGDEASRPTKKRRITEAKEPDIAPHLDFGLLDSPPRCVFTEDQICDKEVELIFLNSRAPSFEEILESLKEDLSRTVSEP